MRRIKKLLLISLVAVGFLMVTGLQSQASTLMYWPKGAYRTHLSSAAKGTWIRKFKHNGWFKIKITTGKYAYVTDKVPRQKPTTFQSSVIKYRGTKKNQFILYTPYADSVTVKWSRHHIYYLGYDKPNDWIRMSRVSK